jgi:hypothetical protein
MKQLHFRHNPAQLCHKVGYSRHNLSFNRLHWPVLQQNLPCCVLMLVCSLASFQNLSGKPSITFHAPMGQVYLVHKEESASIPFRPGVQNKQINFIANRHETTYNDSAQPDAEAQNQENAGTNRRQKAREELPALLRAVFHSHWNDQDVLLTVDAGWRNDSLSVEYKYYKGNNLLSLDENLLIEKIYFTVRPEEIDALETENDEFLFLYLRNTRKLGNVRQLVTRPAAQEHEDNWRSSFGIPVRAENLALIIQYLKDLRQPEP